MQRPVHHGVSRMADKVRAGEVWNADLAGLFVVTGTKSVSFPRGWGCHVMHESRVDVWIYIPFYVEQVDEFMLDCDESLTTTWEEVWEMAKCDHHAYA